MTSTTYEGGGGEGGRVPHSLAQHSPL